MKLGFNLKLEQTQKLIITQELRQAIELLQYNSLELNDFLKKEIQENPLLELDGNLEKVDKIQETEMDKEIDWKEFINKYDDISYRPQVDKNQEESSLEAYVSYMPSLKEYLIEQFNLVNLGKEEYRIGQYIIESIDRNGYLQSKLEEIAEEFNIGIEIVEEVLKTIQSFEPLGVGARDLKECLLIQIREDQSRHPQAEKIISLYLEDLGSNKMVKISKELGIEISQVQKACDYIKTLEPKPGRAFSDGNLQDVRYIHPDASIDFIDGELLININDSTGPRLNINNFYKDIIQKDGDEKAKEFLSERLNSAMWIIKSIEQRRQTIYKVIESIVKFQIDFFKTGVKGLVPLNLKDVAEDIGMHESTVSRATNGKYVQTPRGLFELKYFFTTGLSGDDGDLSTTKIKNMIKNIIDGEDKTKPYSDQKIVDSLKESGIDISRRTVAKYRDELDIPSSTMRKRFA